MSGLSLHDEAGARGLARLHIGDSESAPAAAAAPAPRGAKRRMGNGTNMMGRAVELVASVPTEYCKIVRHPCTFVQKREPELKACLELQIDATEYVSNPKGIVNLLGRSHTTTMSVLRLLYLFGCLANKTLAQHDEMVPGEDDGTGRKERPHKKKVDSDSQMCITFERVPSAADPNVFVCHRWRFREYGPPHSRYSMIYELASLMGDNAAQKNKTQRGPALRTYGKPAAAAGEDEHLPTNIEISDWISLCEFHRPSLAVERIQAANRGEAFKNMEPNSIYQQTCRYWPTNAFNPSENLEVARRMGADPRYCDPDTYCATDGYGGTLQRFAENGKNVWQVAPECLKPKRLHMFYMPFQVQSPLGFLPERALWARAHRIAPELQREIFDATRNSSSRMSEENDIAALMHRNEAERAELLFKHRKNKHSADGPVGRGDVEDAYHSELYALQRGKWMSAFMEIFNPQGNCPPAIQRIAEDFNGYLNINNQIMGIPQGQLFTNLRRFSNQRVTEAIAFNEIMTVATEHQSCVLFIYSALHVYSRVLLQCHHLLLGPPGIGKSFALLMLEQLLIKDTFRKYSYITPKGLAIPGKSQASLIMIIEDGQPSLLGVSGGSGGKQTAASSDIEALIKQFLTSTELQIQSVTMEPKRAGEFARCETGCIMFIAMNDSSNLFPKAILDRFCVTLGAAVANDKSKDAASRLMAMSERDASAIIKNVKIEFKLWFSRKQMLHAFLLHMETVGQLHPIDVSVADYVFGLMANFAEVRGLHMMTQRNVVRYRDVVRSFVVTNAIDLVWDSPQAPFRDTPFHMTHLLAVNKYLFCTVEIAVFVIGLISRMWQDNAYADLISTMKRLWFPSASARVYDYENLAPLTSDKVDLRIAHVNHPEVPDGYYSRRKNIALAHASVEPPSAKKAKKAGGAAAAASSNQPKMDDHYASHDKELDRVCNAYDVAKAAADANERQFKNWAYDWCDFGSSHLPAMSQMGPHAHKLDDVVEFLTAKILPEMSARYLPNEIRAKIRNMLETPVNVQRTRVKNSDLDLANLEEGVDPDSIPDRTVVQHEEVMQLVIDPECIRLAIPTLKHADSSKDVVMECLTEALTVLYGAALKAPRQEGDDPEAYSQFLYGETEKESDKRYNWRMIKLDRAAALRVDVAKSARVFNSSYAAPMKQRVMKEFLHSMDPAYVDPAVMMRLYSANSPFSIVNTSPDAMAALLRADELGLSYADQHEVLPSNDPSRYNRAFKAHYEERAERNGEPMATYPEDFNKHDAAYWQEQMRNNPEQFYSSKVYAEMQARQALRPSIYQRDLAAPSVSMPSLESPVGEMQRSIAAASAAASVMDDEDVFDEDENDVARGMDMDNSDEEEEE